MGEQKERDDRIEQIRSWRDHVADVYGVPHERGDSDLVCNNKAWWADVDALLDALDERAPIVAAARAWGAAKREHAVASAEWYRFAGGPRINGKSDARSKYDEATQVMRDAVAALRAALGTEGDAT